MAPRTRTRATPVSSLEADALQRALHALGDYAHVAVRAERGHLTVFIDDGAPVARVTPLGATQYGLSFPPPRQGSAPRRRGDRFTAAQLPAAGGRRGRPSTSGLTQWRGRSPRSTRT